MKLVKATNSDKHAEDFGLLHEDAIYLYDHCMECAWRGEKVSGISSDRLDTSPVLRVNALWVEKEIKVACSIADTMELKIQGLQGVDSLEQHRGMYFPYVPYQTVRIHQGSVPFELDLIFLQDDMVCRVQEHTKVGSSDVWSCPDCTALLEVNGGFCALNKVRVGDRVALFAVSEKDVVEVEEEKHRVVSGVQHKSRERYESSPNLVHLISAIADSL